jgi:ribosomal protein S18 acetylase RimI-like enzyme
MGIATPYQNTGLGRRLYREAEERLRKDGVRMIIADTEGDNAQAIGFFKAQGFIPRGQHVWLAKTLRGKSKGPASATSNEAQRKA